MQSSTAHRYPPSARRFHVRPTHLLVFAVTLLLGCSTAPREARAQNDDGRQASLTVSVSGFENANGVARIVVYDAQGSFPRPKGSARASSVERIEDGQVQASFAELPLGDYVVLVLHDANDNDELDTNFLGMPQEGYGISKNRFTSVGAPDYEEGAFTLPPEGSSLAIEMKY
ncbi:MAG: DUF2141 domain-containing protein [Myxococcota bacterium]|jgi:uncharacterized protein (DUF2141 family)|nr:DUF2141 domain-containing protein [Myxococcota bacterium]